MSKNKYEGSLKRHKVPCMKEGCKKFSYVRLPEGEVVAKSFRKWCPQCRKAIEAYGVGIDSHGGRNAGDRRA